MLSRTLRLPLLALIASVHLAAEAPPVDGTLPEDHLPGLKILLKEAVESSPSSITANIGLAQAEAGLYINESSLWPSLNVSSDYQVSKESISSSSTSTAQGFTYNIGVSQPLFQWGAYKNQADIGKLSQKVAEKQFAEAYRILVISIREQYLAMIGKKMALRNTEFALKLQKEALAVAQAKFDAGSISQAELGTYKMNVEQFQLDADRAEEDYAYSRRLITRLVGIGELSDDSVPIEVPHPVFDAEKADTVLAGFVGNGIESTFQSEIYKLLIEEQDKNYRIAKVRLLPKFSASAGLSYSNQTSTNGITISQVGVQSESYAIAGNWAIFDGFATRGSKMSALASKRTYERQEQSYVDETVDRIADMRKQLGFSSRAMSIAEVHNALIAAEVKRIGDDKALGYASQATIDAGILNLYATEFGVAYARTDYYSRWVEFISLAGIDPALQNIEARYVR